MKILKFSFLVHLQSHYYKLFYPEVLVCFTFFFFFALLYLPTYSRSTMKKLEVPWEGFGMLQGSLKTLEEETLTKANNMRINEYL